MTVGIYIQPAHAVPPQEKRILAPWILTKQLTDLLIAHHHSIFLFAAKTSETNAKLYDFDIFPTTRLRTKLAKKAYEQRKRADEALLFHSMIGVAKENHIKCVHIMHDERYMYPLLKDAPCDMRFVITIHNPIVGDRKRVIESISKLKNCHLLSISKSQQRNVSANFFKNVYNGVDLKQYPFSDAEGNYFLTAGRIIPEKGHYDAIIACQQLNHALHIIGEVRPLNKTQQKYWDSAIHPFIDGKNISYSSFLSPEELFKTYQHAKALLFPIHWEEPFGLVMIEAAACGTPVIAYARGAVPEVVVDGVTGFIVNESEKEKRGNWIIKKTGVDGLVEAMRQIGKIDRHACRKHVENNFTVETMAKAYEMVYKKVMIV